MDIQEQIKLTEELLEGVKELNGEYQEGWENVIENAEKLINQLKQGSKLPMHDVSVREFECDDVVCTNDGKMWVITEIDGDDVYVTGNGKKDYPLEKSDITHAH